jgi:hypothetical protein
MNKKQSPDKVLNHVGVFLVIVFQRNAIGKAAATNGSIKNPRNVIINLPLNICYFYFSICLSHSLPTVTFKVLGVYKVF